MNRLRPWMLAAAVFVAAPAAARAQAAQVTLLGYRATPPAAWTPRQPSSSSRLAEFVVPGKTPAENAEVVVYFFGPQMGGNVDANLARWKDQFSTPDGSSVYEKVTRDSTGKFPLTFAEYHGTYRRGIGAGSADSVRTGQALISSIVQTPNGTMFIQLFGPEARVIAEREAFIKFVKELK